MQTTTTRLSAALDSMKQQARAAIAVMPIPGNDPKQAKRNLKEAQQVMFEHDAECKLIYKAAQIWNKPIPDIELSELVDTGVCGLANIQEIF